MSRVYQGLPETHGVFETGQVGTGTVPHLANPDQTMYLCWGVMGIGGFFHLICSKYFTVEGCREGLKRVNRVYSDSQEYVQNGNLYLYKGCGY